MGCCSSNLSAALDSNSTKYTETGSQSLHFATPQIQIHACAAGFFRHATIQQLICMDVRDDHILAAIGHAEDPAMLSAQLRSLPQVYGSYLIASPDGIQAVLADTCQRVTSTVQGSSLAIVHINQRTLKMCMACCGGANAVLGELVHGLAAQVAEASLLCPQTGRDEQSEDTRPHSTAQDDPPAVSSPQGASSEQQPVQVVERQLLPVHEHVIVGLPGLWAVTSPDAAALRTHFYLRGMSGGRGSGREGQAPCQTAGHLARFAEGQARDAGAPVGALVITLRWPSSSMNQAFTDQGLRDALKGGRPSAAAGARERSSQRARQHWRLVQSLYVEYVRAHRRVLHAKWRKVIRLAMAEGIKRAHKLEQQIWLRDNLVVTVSPSLKIRNQKGQEIRMVAQTSGLDVQQRLTPGQM